MLHYSNVFKLFLKQIIINHATGQIMYVNIQKAIDLTGLSRSTIQRHIKTGKLSRTEKGIDTAELIRVYGELKQVNEPGSKMSKDNNTINQEWFMKQIESLQNELKQVRAEAMERERQALEREKLANEREARIMALLENKSLFGGLFKK